MKLRLRFSTPSSPVLQQWKRLRKSSSYLQQQHQLASVKEEQATMAYTGQNKPMLGVWELKDSKWQIGLCHLQGVSSYVPSPLCNWKYNVFLSFRGKDTCKNFTDHLYAAFG
ncbi:hypothetical protein CUMW_233650 [Citrus unshiu]|uniref:TIR domain-containing protein n=1 Tax=Citrus unshiu TaxID=55188 RepID=A0A2H5QIM4_CITUN|nr:hypothetical protein CUMW_233650 [Citrus unshiu]